MTKTLLAALALFATAAAHAQMVAPPPMRPPMVRPVVNEPYFPTPGATPAGAGLETGDTSTAPALHRSPNKRVLPVSRESGLWAADGAPVASVAERLFGVDIPEPNGSAELVEASRACVSTVAAAARAVGADKDALLFPPRVRDCMATWAYLMCAKHRVVALRPPSRGAPAVEFERAEAVTRLAMHAFKVSSDACRDVVRTKEQMDILDAVDERWLFMMGGGVP